MANRISSREPVQGNAVVIDKPDSSFHGMIGQVIRVMEPATAGPTLFRVLLDPPPDGYEQGTHFLARELVVLGR